MWYEATGGAISFKNAQNDAWTLSQQWQTQQYGIWSGESAHLILEIEI